MPALLPLFPLQLVVFPRTQVPLHIFEDRYKEMVGAAIRENSEFGIVLAKDGGIVNAGCTVGVDRVLTNYPDGRLDVVASGRKRFEIVYINQEKAYLQAEVHYFEDEAVVTIPAEVRARAVDTYREFQASQTTGDKAVEPDSSDGVELSFSMAQTVPDLDLQSRVLRSRSELERLQQLTRFFEEQIPRAREIARMRHLAPMNGYGRKIAEI